MKLTIELVPASSWFSNMRTMVPKKEWDRLRKQVYKDAGNRCEICGGKGRRHPVECHEIWSYDDATGTQSLDGLIALCPACHQVKHIGLANIRGYGDHALRHLCKVNGITPSEGDAYVDRAFEVYHRRSDRKWTLDLSWAEQHDVQFLTEAEAKVARDKAWVKSLKFDASSVFRGMVPK